MHLLKKLRFNSYLQLVLFQIVNLRFSFYTRCNEAQNWISNTEAIRQVLSLKDLRQEGSPQTPQKEMKRSFMWKYEHTLPLLGGGRGVGLQHNTNIETNTPPPWRRLSQNLSSPPACRECTWIVICGQECFYRGPILKCKFSAWIPAGNSLSENGVVQTRCNI